MNLTFRDIRKLKGTYLIDKENELCHVKSSTKNKIVIECVSYKASILPSIFLETKQKNYRLVSNEEMAEIMETRYLAFLDDNYDEIIALAHTKKYAFWGGNAIPMAEADLLEAEGYHLNLEYIDAEEVKQKFLAD